MKTFNQYSQNTFENQQPAFLLTIQEHFQQLSSLHNKSTYEKPWFFFIGPNLAGKTTFLRQAQLSVSQILSPDNPIIQSWICDNAVHIDIQNKALPANELVNSWQQIATTLEKTKNHHFLSGIIFALNIQDLANQTKLQREALLNDYIKIISILSATTPRKIPTYVLFTHCDRIGGFNEYFDDLSKQDRQAPCGFLFEDRLLPLLEEFNEKYNTILKNLNDAIIKRLHLAPKRQDRARIYDFPLHMESNKAMLTDCFKYFVQHEENLEPRGCFFVSNLQEGVADDRLSRPITQTFTIQMPASQYLPLISQSFFSHRLACDILPVDHLYFSPPAKTERRWLRFSGHVATIGISTSLFLALTSTVFHQFNVIQNTNQQLVHYQTHKPTVLKDSFENQRQLIDALFELNKTQYQLSHASKLWFDLFPLSEYHKIAPRVKHFYEEEMRHTLYPRLTHTIEKYLSHLGKTDPDEIYSALKAYLMMGIPEHRHADYLTQWLAYRWEQNPEYNVADIESTINHLKPLLTDNPISMDLNIDTINEAQNYLNRLPPSLLGLLALKSQAISLQTDTPSNHAANQTKAFTIPYLFTKQGFRHFFAGELNHISQSVLSGNWILGHHVPPKNTTADMLTAELKKLYTEDYIHWWQQFMVKVTMPTFTTLQDATDAFQKLAADDSILLDIIRTLHDNTLPMTENDETATLFNLQIASQFQQYGAILNNAMRLTEQFNQVANDLQAIASSSDHNASAFEMQQALFKNDNTRSLNALVESSENLPPPLNFWLTQLIDQCWKVLTPKSLSFLQTTWQSQVMQEYNEKIKLHYPIRLDSKTEITLTDFNHFFAPSGTLDQFYNRYIKDFLDTHSANWQPKHKGQWEFPVRSEFIEQMIRADLIRKMFFGEKHEARLNFSLKPLKFDSSIKDMTLDLDGQLIYTYQGSSKIQQLSWPGPDKEGRLNLVFNNKDGSKSFISESGPWAWFRLLEKLQLKKLESPQKFELSIDLNGTAAQFELQTDAVVNPFLANMLEGMELSEVS